jgi:hypothetical protein
MEIRLETALVWNGKDQATDCLSVSPALIDCLEPEWLVLSVMIRNDGYVGHLKLFDYHELDDVLCKYIN